MLSQSLSDRQSSTSTPARPLGRVAQAGVLAVVTIAVTAVVYVATAQVLPQALAVMAAGTVVVLALGGATFWSVHRDAVRRRSAEDWHRRLRRELIEQSAFLDGLVGGLGTMSSTLDPALVLERATEQAHQLLAPDATVLLVPAADGNGLRPAAARGIGLGPIADVVVETNSSARFAPVADRGGDDALSKRLRPTARLTVPIVAVDELRGLLVLMRLRGTGAVQPGRADPGVGARRLRRHDGHERPPLRPGRIAPRPGPDARDRAGRPVTPGCLGRAGRAPQALALPPRRPAPDHVGHRDDARRGRRGHGDAATSRARSRCSRPPASGSAASCARCVSCRSRSSRGCCATGVRRSGRSAR